MTQTRREWRARITTSYSVSSDTCPHLQYCTADYTFFVTSKCGHPEPALWAVTETRDYQQTDSDEPAGQHSGPPLVTIVTVWWGGGSQLPYNHHTTLKFNQIQSLINLAPPLLLSLTTEAADITLSYSGVELNNVSV